MHDRHAMVVPADFRGIGGTTVRTVRVHETWARTERNPNPGLRPMTITDADGNVATAKVELRRGKKPTAIWRVRNSAPLLTNRSRVAAALDGLTASQQDRLIAAVAAGY
jgi:hypothetical protein